MCRKTEQIQIRVSAAEKAAIKRLADGAGMDLSTYVRTRALPRHRERFSSLLRRLADADPADRSYVLAELNDLLAGLTPAELTEAVARPGEREIDRLSPYERNYVAAMVEEACAQRGVRAPKWTSAVPPLERPRFVVELVSLRPHLLRASPVPFKRRNIFIDSTIGDRV